MTRRGRRHHSFATLGLLGALCACRGPMDANRPASDLGPSGSAARDATPPPDATSGTGARAEPSAFVVTRLRSIDVSSVQQVVAGREPTPAHSRGTLFVAAGATAARPSARVLELDGFDGRVIASAELPNARGRTVSIAATRPGLVAVTSRAGERSELHAFDRDLRPTAFVDLGLGTQAAVSARGSLAVVARVVDDAGATELELATFDATTAKLVARRRTPGSVPDVRVRAEVLLGRGAVYVVAFGPVLGVRSFAARTLDPIAEYARTLPAPTETWWTRTADGYLALSRHGLLVTFQDQLVELDRALRPRRSWPALPDGSTTARPAVNEATDELFLASGWYGASVGAPLRRAVDLEHGSLGTTPLGDPILLDTPLAALFVGGKPVLATANPGLRLTRFEPRP